jgi:hypothetical protein
MSPIWQRTFPEQQGYDQHRHRQGKSELVNGVGCDRTAAASQWSKEDLDELIVARYVEAGVSADELVAATMYGQQIARMLWVRLDLLA